MSKTLDQAMKDRWEDFAVLTNLVPADRVFLGAPDYNADRPFVVIVTVTDSEPEYTTCRDYIEGTLLQLSVFGRTLLEAASIRNKADAIFNNKPLELDGPDRVIDVLRSGGGKLREEDDTWHCWYEYEIDVQSKLEP